MPDALLRSVAALLYIMALIGRPIEKWYDSPERLWLARAVQGEVGVMGEHRELAGNWVVHVAMNRVESAWFPNTLTEVVRQGFYGAATIDQPDQWAYEAVGKALEQRASGEDPTSGSYFLFGGQDVLECMDFDQRVGVLRREGWVFSVHLFRYWPYPEGCWYQ